MRDINEVLKHFKDWQEIKKKIPKEEIEQVLKELNAVIDISEVKETITSFNEIL